MKKPALAVLVLATQVAGASLTGLTYHYNGQEIAATRLP